jgi:hypothetical protein
MRTFHVKELTQSNGKRNDARRPQPLDTYHMYGDHEEYDYGAPSLWGYHAPPI